VNEAFVVVAAPAVYDRLIVPPDATAGSTCPAFAAVHDGWHTESVPFDGRLSTVAVTTDASMSATVKVNAAVSVAGTTSESGHVRTVAPDVTRRTNGAAFTDEVQ
jgi:hypothetical protein